MHADEIDDDEYLEESDVDDGGMATARTLSNYEDEQQSFSDVFEEFKDTIIQFWESMCDDPYGFISEFLGMLHENKKVCYPAFFILIMILVSLFAPRSLSHSEMAKIRYMNLSTDIKFMVEDMKTIQPGTKLDLRRSLTHSARRLSGLDDNLKSQQPVVVLFAVTDQSQIQNLTAKFEHAVKKHTDSFVVSYDCDSLVSRMDFEKRIFSQLHQAQKRHKLLILRNIDQLSHMTPLVLHSLADNENSPFRDLVIFATVTLDKMPKQCTEVLERRLFDAWTNSELNTDMAGAIVSRLSAVVACVQ